MRGVIGFSEFMLLFVTFDIMLGRYICWTRSCKFVCHLQSLTSTELRSREKRPVTQPRTATAVKCRSHRICVLSQSNLFRPPPPLHKFRRTFLELNYQKPFPKKKGKNRRRLFTSSLKREVEYLGSVHTYLDIFSFRVRLPSSRIR